MEGYSKGRPGDKAVAVWAMIALCAVGLLGLVIPTASGIQTERSSGMDLQTLAQHQKTAAVTYSDPKIRRDYKSNPVFNPRGMEHVYTITHLFLSVILRRDVLPPSINASVLIDTDQSRLMDILSENWEELLLQYIGLVTVAICGLLAAVALPIAGVCVCCCRCAGKCGGYPEHFDKRGDSCRRVVMGAILACLVTGAMFGVVSAFVTNQYSKEGIYGLPARLKSAADDTGLYLDNTGEEFHNLLVTNFRELEGVLNQTLDDSGPILKRNLAVVTQATAIDNLADIVSGLGSVRRHLRSIQNSTIQLQNKVGQLRLGLGGSQDKLSAALRQCGEACLAFLEEYNVDRDLAITADFQSLPLELPDLSLLMKDIQSLIDSNIEFKVRDGQRQLDKVKEDIENSVVGVRPRIKAEIHLMGEQLADKAAEVQRVLNEFHAGVATLGRDVPKVSPYLVQSGDYLYYVGLATSTAVLLILACFVLGLFYGFCGKRPGNVYGDDCCNKGTGANWLLAGAYLTFMLSFFLLVIVTTQFLAGAALHKVACDALKDPASSDVFEVVDFKFLQPALRQKLGFFDDQGQRGQDQSLGQAEPLMRSRVDGATPLRDDFSVRGVIESCHRNSSIYEILQMREVYDIEELRDWKTRYEVGNFLENLKARIRTAEDVRNIQILSPQAQKDLEELAGSQISDLNFTQYTRLIEDKITSIDLGQFIRSLRQVRRKLDRSQDLLVGLAIENEALFLEQMKQVVVEMKLIMRQLSSNVEALEKEAKFNKVNLRDALRGLINQASKATEFIRSEGPQLIERLAEGYVNETVGLIDDYVDRVINYTQNSVGKCYPISTSYNATVVGFCQEIVDPVNGFWASVGWCVMFFLPAIAFALSLVSLYRKSEPYPGPILEPGNDEPGLVDLGNNGPPSRSQGGPPHGRGVNSAVAAGNNNKKKRGHRRNLSEYLPDSAHHYRTGYAYQSDDQRFRDASAPRASSSYTSPLVGTASLTSAPSPSAPSSAAAAAAGASSSSVIAAAGTGGAILVDRHHQPSGGPPRYTSNPNLDNPEYERPPPYYFPGASAPLPDAPPPLPAPNRSML